VKATGETTSKKTAGDGGGCYRHYTTNARLAVP
jgi:hypothetical protein